MHSAIGSSNPGGRIEADSLAGSRIYLAQLLDGFADGLTGNNQPAYSAASNLLVVAELQSPTPTCFLTPSRQVFRLLRQVSKRDVRFLCLSQTRKTYIKLHSWWEPSEDGRLGWDPSFEKTLGPLSLVFDSIKPNLRL